MDLVLARLAPPATGNRQPLSPATVSDILWTVAVPDDRLEHIRARHGPFDGSIDVAFFLRTGTESAEAVSSRLCRRALQVAPALFGWRLIGTTPTLIPELGHPRTGG
jgi:hypothetical protein